MDSGYFAVWAKFYKKEFLDEHGDILVFPENTAFGDVRFHIASMILASRISFVNDFLYRYTLSNKNSITQNKSNRMDIFGVVDSVEEFFMKTGYFEEFKDDFMPASLHSSPSKRAVKISEEDETQVVEPKQDLTKTMVISKR
jgi:hypothetical protein